MTWRNALLLTLSVLASTACWRRPLPLPALPADGPCLREPPPAPPGIYVSGPTEGCEPVWTGCLDHSNATRLAQHLAASQRWESEAWLRCGPVPDGGTR